MSKTRDDPAVSISDAEFSTRDHPIVSTFQVESVPGDHSAFQLESVPGDRTTFQELATHRKCEYTRTSMKEYTQRICWVARDIQSSQWFHS